MPDWAYLYHIMKLTIITINRNNASGLEKTMESVLSQTCKEYEYVVVDGASTDASVEVIKRFAGSFGGWLKWISEPDKGIYNAMNKGIRMAGGEYVQFLNSGDRLADRDVVSKMYKALEEKGNPSVLYGNMLKDLPDGRMLRDRSFAGRPITLKGMYRGSFNHSPAYIKRDLFDKYGEYDESLKIVSDWKWYLQSIVLGEEVPVYVNLDVTVFDMTGISETNLDLLDQERRDQLAVLIKPGILSDYDAWKADWDVMERLRRYPLAYKLVHFMERVLFKWEKKKLREYIKR